MLQLFIGVGPAADKLEVVEAVEVGIGELHRHRHLLLAQLLAGREAIDIAVVHVGTDHLGTLQVAEQFLNGKGRIAGVTHECSLVVLEVAFQVHRAVAVLLRIDIADADVQDERHHHCRSDGHRCARDVDSGEEFVFADECKGVSYDLNHSCNS